MPRASFSASAFSQAASPGLGKLASALSGDAFEQGRQGEVMFQSKLANALAQQRAHDATADLSAAKADGERAQNAMQTPEAVQRTAMTANGIPLDDLGAVASFLQTGELGGKYAPAADGMGPMAARPAYAGAGPEIPGLGPSKVVPGAQDKLGDVARAIAGIQTALTIGDKNSENIAKAGAINREGRLSDDILAGRADRNTVGGAQAAVAGKTLFHEGSDGGVLDQYTGGLNADGPLAQSTIGLRGAQAGNQKAGANAHNAQAEASRALAEQRKQITKNGPGPGKVPVGYRYTTGEDGEARLEPIPGGPKDPNAQTGKPLPASAAKGYLDNHQNLRRAEKALALVQGLTVGGAKGDPDATGWKGAVPNLILNRMDPDGVETRAAIADLGSLVIHDRSGAAVTASEYPRLAPFIPSATDDAATAEKKLKQFVQNYKAVVEDAGEFYKASGYNVPAFKETPVSKPPAGKAGAAPAAPGAFTYLGKE